MMGNINRRDILRKIGSTALISSSLGSARNGVTNNETQSNEASVGVISITNNSFEEIEFTILVKTSKGPHLTQIQKRLRELNESESLPPSLTREEMKVNLPERAGLKIIKVQSSNAETASTEVTFTSAGLPESVSIMIRMGPDGTLTADTTV
jgi:hypothetical protein